MIYLDYSANTPVDARVLEQFCAVERRCIGNANSHHQAGSAAKAEIDAATITPDANPSNSFCTFSFISFRIKNTIAAPRAVIENVKPVPAAAHKSACCMCISSCG
jgi:hypothetical protein